MTTRTPEDIARETARYAIDTAQQAWPESNGPLLRLVTDAVLDAIRSAVAAETVRATAAENERCAGIARTEAEWSGEAAELNIEASIRAKEPTR